MLITEDNSQSNYIIQSFTAGSIIINKATYTNSVVISPTYLLTDWPPQNLHELTHEHLTIILQQNPEVVLLGTGTSIQFPNPSLLRPLYEHNIGTEIMDTSAACRTFNVLTAEGRRVVAALFTK